MQPLRLVQLCATTRKIANAVAAVVYGVTLLHRLLVRSLSHDLGEKNRHSSGLEDFIFGPSFILKSFIFYFRKIFYF